MTQAEVERLEKILEALTRFLASEQAGKSIMLQMEATRLKDDFRPKIAHEWAALREAFQLNGYPTAEETENHIRKILGL